MCSARTVPQSTPLIRAYRDQELCTARRCCDSNPDLVVIIHKFTASARNRFVRAVLVVDTLTVGLSGVYGLGGVGVCGS